MTSTQIDCFLAAAQAESFATAADSMYMTPPTFGRQISTLEQELGFPLFRRGWKNSQLTPAGQVMYEGLVPMRQALSALIDSARAADASVTGHLLLGLLEGQMVDPCLREVVAQFEAAFPGVTLEIQYFSFRAMLESIEKGSLDAGITLTASTINRHDFNILPLYTAKNEVVMLQSHPLACREELSLTDLAGETFVEIEQSDSPAVARLIQESCRKAGFAPKMLTVKDLKEKITAIELGRGIAALNNYHQSFNHPELIHRPVSELPEVEFSLIWRKDADNPALPYLLEQFQIVIQQPE